MSGRDAPDVWHRWCRYVKGKTYYLRMTEAISQYQTRPCARAFSENLSSNPSHRSSRPRRCSTASSTKTGAKTGSSTSSTSSHGKVKTSRTAIPHSGTQSYPPHPPHPAILTNFPQAVVARHPPLRTKPSPTTSKRRAPRAAVHYLPIPAPHDLRPRPLPHRHHAPLPPLHAHPAHTHRTPPPHHRPRPLCGPGRCDGPRWR